MTILDRILNRKREEIRALFGDSSDERHAEGRLREQAADAAPVPSFTEALRAPGAPHLIAEVKKASPSKGLIRPDFDPVAIARAYARGGAACLSVLTDRDFFQGDLAYLKAIREQLSADGTPKPLLRKDFIIHELQILEAKAFGASAILLIAAALDGDRLAALHREAESCGLDVLVEVHDDADLDKVLGCGANLKLLGVNNRDLRTFEVDLAVTERLAARIPDSVVFISESGIFTPDDVARVAGAGASAVLVGESLMRQPDPGAAAAELMRPLSRTD
ncbi:MAG: indole-3-glycerol phosphate synthase TrpC [Sumerlaeia bacterium]